MKNELLFSFLAIQKNFHNINLKKKYCRPLHTIFIQENINLLIIRSLIDFKSIRVHKINYCILYLVISHKLAACCSHKIINDSVATNIVIINSNDIYKYMTVNEKYFSSKIEYSVSMGNFFKRVSFNGRILSRIQVDI